MNNIISSVYGLQCDSKYTAGRASTILKTQMHPVNALNTQSRAYTLISIAQ